MNERRPWSIEEIYEYLKELDEYRNKKDLKIDMHNHTTGSDGDDSPLKLLLRAHAMGLDTISITDHNSVKGYQVLKEQIERIIKDIEEINSREDLTEKEKEYLRVRAKRIFKIIEELKIIPGCEILTIFKGCPYVEILAYGADLEKLEENMKTIKQGLDSPGEILCKGLKEAAKKHNIVIDEFVLDNRSDYRKLFFHELIKHSENEFLYKDIDGDTEEEKTENFAKLYLDNKDSDFYVDLNSPKTRKKAMLAMIKNHEGLTFDIKVFENIGSASGQFYNDLIKHPENKNLIDERIVDQKTFNYLGLYNEKSPFFVDLSSTKPSLESVVKAIRDAGGKAVVAHWGRYKLSNEEVFDWNTEIGMKNLKEIIDICDGAECEYPDNPIELRKIIYDLCKKNGKITSMGGDNHGKSGKEGKQYQLGSQKGREVDSKSWIKDLVVNGKDFITQIEEEHHFRRRLLEIMNEKIEAEKNVKEVRVKEEDSKDEASNNMKD